GAFPDKTRIRQSQPAGDKLTVPGTGGRRTNHHPRQIPRHRFPVKHPGQIDLLHFRSLPLPKSLKFPVSLSEIVRCRKPRPVPPLPVFPPPPGFLPPLLLPARGRSPNRNR